MTIAVIFILALVLIGLVLAMIIFKNLQTIDDMKSNLKTLDNALKDKDRAIKESITLRKRIKTLENEYNKILNEFEAVVQDGDPVSIIGKFNQLSHDKD